MANVDHEANKARGAISLRHILYAFQQQIQILLVCGALACVASRIYTGRATQRVYHAGEAASFIELSVKAPPARD